MTPKTEDPSPREATTEEMKGRLMGLHNHRERCKNKWDDDRNEMKRGRQESLNELVSQRGKGLKHHARARDSTKEIAKKQFIQHRDKAQQDFKDEVEEAGIERDAIIKEMKSRKEQVYKGANNAYHTSIDSCIVQYKKDVAEVEEDFVEEMRAIKDAEEADFATIDEAIKKSKDSLGISDEKSKSHPKKDSKKGKAA